MKGNKTMTKKEMLDYIEESGMILDFDRKYLMRCLKSRIEHFYKMAQEFNKRKVAE